MDYYVEFYKNSDALFCEFAEELAKLHPDFFVYKNISLKELIIPELYMYGLSAGWKEKYNHQRLNGINANILKADFLEELKTTFFWNNKEQGNIKNYSKENKDWAGVLSVYKHQLMIYLFNERQLSYLIPLINTVKSPLVLLCDFEVSENIDFSDSVSIIEFGFSSVSTFQNEYLEIKFPYIYHYLNTFEQIISSVMPFGIVFLEGCHLQEKALNIVAHSHNLKTFCIQQGWPSFMHTLFRRYSYDYFLTWGTLFNNLWSKHNPTPSYIECGYMYDVKETKNKQSITFFLQSPVFLSDNEYFEEILYLIVKTAERLPRTPIQIREHPEYKINYLWIERLRTFKNVQFVGDIPIAEVYSNTLVAVSHFSSCIMESIIHNCIPFVFDPTTNSRYYPDIEQMGLGLISKDQYDFLNKIEILLSNVEIQQFYFHNIAKRKDEICKNISIDTIKKIAFEIESRCV